MFEKEKKNNKEFSSVASKEVAKERLKNILMRDRVDVSSDLMDTVKDDLVSVVKDYFTVKDYSAEVYLTSMKKNRESEDETVLVALMPIGKLKSRELLQAEHAEC